MTKNIIYHIGETINSQTIVKKGKICLEEQDSRIESNNTVYNLDKIKNVELFKMNGLGTMIKLHNGDDTIYLSIPRIFINIGTGFAIINYFSTKKLYSIIKNKMQNI